MRNDVRAVAKNKLDLSEIAAAIERDLAWPTDRLAASSESYLSFFLSDEEGQCPSHDVDVFWHYHISDGEKYRDDCIRVHGRIVLHVPNAEGKGLGYCDKKWGPVARR